ncbi:MAG: hypothetical protein ACK4OK_09570, partial [Thermoflexus sp.]
ARPNTGGLGRVWPSEAEAPEARWPLAWKAPEIPPEGAVLAIPVRRLYHEGTLIARTPHLRSRTIPLAAKIHPETAQNLRLGAGRVVTIRVNGQEVHLPVHIDPAIPPQVLWLPVSLVPRAGVLEALPVELRVEVGDGTFSH